MQSLQAQKKKKGGDIHNVIVLKTVEDSLMFILSFVTDLLRMFS